MRPYLYSILIFVLLASGMACRKNFEYAPSAGNLEFSKDTVYLDTIFSNIGSSTYSLKVYNPTRDDVEIPSIRLQNGTQSGYRLNVDGVPGKEFQNIPILAQDSMFIFIETTFHVSPHTVNELLYTDKLLFDVDTDEQSVELVTLVKDAVFLFPNKDSEGKIETISIGNDSEGNSIKVDGFSLQDNQLHFTNEKPYVIYGYAAVSNEKTLLIDAGARVHFHKDSGIYIDAGAKLMINGSLSSDSKLLENEVIFEGDRLEPQFESISGQWGALLITNGSTGNTINYLTIKNATVGLKIQDELNNNSTSENTNLEIKNSQIYNSENINLWAQSASILAENLVLGAAGSQSLYCNMGGAYNFSHCTIANYWIKDFRLSTALQIDNFSNDKSYDLFNADFTNCIIYGAQSREISLVSNETNTFNFSFTNCLIRYADNAVSTDSFVLDFDNENHFKNNIINQPPEFFDSFGGDYRINELSSANGTANLETALEIPLDIRGVNRNVNPDIGAFESTLQE
ncbi:hypothetical protein [Aurantibacter sp.]|uniref:hypothetical protein n=1 Tax=Aurantibacter sp. TaxID=2807103 RepID=UPI0032672DB5